MIEMMRRKDGGVDEQDIFLSEAGFWVAVCMMLLEFALFYKYFIYMNAMRQGFPDTRLSDRYMGNSCACCPKCPIPHRHPKCKTVGRFGCAECELMTQR